MTGPGGGGAGADEALVLGGVRVIGARRNDLGHWVMVTGNDWGR